MKEQAIEVIREARQSHVEWADFIRNNPEAASQPQEIRVTAGDVAHHEDWIKKYDLVLEVLNGDKT